MATEKNNSATLFVRSNDNDVRFKKRYCKVDFEILIQDCEGMNFNDNSQSGKSQTSNVHDPDVTLNMNTHFASNTDLMNTGFSQKVSSQ